MTLLKSNHTLSARVVQGAAAAEGIHELVVLHVERAVVKVESRTLRNSASLCDSLQLSASRLTTQRVRNSTQLAPYLKK